MADIRKAIFDELGFTCSAGISVNKMAAKFIAGLKKPNAQDRISHVTISKWVVLELKVPVDLRKMDGLMVESFNLKLYGPSKMRPDR